MPDPLEEENRPGGWVVIDGLSYRSVVLCFLFRSAGAAGGAPRTGPSREVLLGLKLTGFGTGRIVALGGKIDGAETPAEAAVREVLEESGVILVSRDLRDAGRITWSFPAEPAWNMAAHLFTADVGESEPRTSEEIEPRWFAFDALPWKDMWKDAAHWVPVLLEGHRIDARIVMAEDNENVTRAVVHRVPAQGPV